MFDYVDFNVLDEYWWLFNTHSMGVSLWIVWCGMEIVIRYGRLMLVFDF